MFSRRLLLSNQLKLRRRYNTHSSTPQLGLFKLPAIENEPMCHYEPGSKERDSLKKELTTMRSQVDKEGPFKVPLIINGEKIITKSTNKQHIPTDHKTNLCEYSEADKAAVQKAIDTALKVKPHWEAMHWNDRAAIFLKAADLLTTKYRHRIMAATMLGQSKNAWQAEIDTAAELADFWRFNTQYADEIYCTQPPQNSTHTWNRTEYRALEGFVVAYSPFNFTAIGGNLVSAPALMGNVVLWKPANQAMYSSYIIMEILREAGLPDGVIQFIPGDPEFITNETFNHKLFAGLHFTGSTKVFQSLWKRLASKLDFYSSYPRIVGETGGKNFHFLHHSADVESAVHNTIRGAFEYQGQKCSATSRVYVPDNLWEEFSSRLKAEVGKIKQGGVHDFSNFMNAVINQDAYDRCAKYIDDVEQDKNSTILVGGGHSAEKGYFIQPTIIKTTNPFANSMKTELFGPVVTCYVYPKDEYIETLKVAAKTTDYALTGSIFSRERQAVIDASNIMRNSAGNFYINDKSTGAVVGQQPFGGGRMSGTNDKAGSALNLLRWVSPRTVKENFVPIKDWRYPSNGAV